MDLESEKPIAKDTIFRIMSMTKPVVGVAILMLVEEGKEQGPPGRPNSSDTAPIGRRGADT